MRANRLKTITKKAAFGLTVLLLAMGVSFAQTVSLTAAPAVAILPDGQQVPMWGYSCGPVSGTNVNCAALNTTGNWSPVVITVPPGPLTISLTNGLPAGIPTSMTIVGQLGGGLGLKVGPGGPTAAPSPTHAEQAATWPIAGDTTGSVFNPPPQSARIQSFGIEVAKRREHRSHLVQSEGRNISN